MPILLRPVTDADLPTLFEHQRDPVSVKMVAFVPRARDEFMAHWGRILSDPECVARAIDEDGVLVGHVVSFPRDGRREIGYWLGREFWGRGLATEALRLFLAEETRRPLHAGVSSHNVGSRRVLLKCGFVVVPGPHPISSAPGASSDDLLLRLDVVAGTDADPGARGTVP